MSMPAGIEGIVANMHKKQNIKMDDLWTRLCCNVQKAQAARRPVIIGCDHHHSQTKRPYAKALAKVSCVCWVPVTAW